VRLNQKRSNHVLVGIYSRREVVNSHDSSSALGGGELIKFRESSSLVCQADKLQAATDLAVRSGLANNHTETLGVISVFSL
jgi:hypothetical protein